MNIAHTTFPMPHGVAQAVYPQLSLSALTTSRPRPFSARPCGFLSTGALELGSATAHRTEVPLCSSPSWTGQLRLAWLNPGTACRSALVSNSDTTVAISSPRSVTPHRCRVARENVRPAWTARSSRSWVWLLISGGQAVPGGSAPGMPAISAANASQGQPVPPLPSGWAIPSPG